MFDHCIYYNLSALTRQITKIWQGEFAMLNLSPSHGYVLFAISNKAGVSQKELSEIMELDASTITRFIDALYAKKLIEKSGAGKGTSYELTDLGRDIVQKVNLVMNDLFSVMQKTFGEQNFSDFVTNLQQARQTIKEQYP